jgi:hypothetical protein
MYYTNSFSSGWNRWSWKEKLEMWFALAMGAMPFVLAFTISNWSVSAGADERPQVITGQIERISMQPIVEGQKLSVDTKLKVTLKLQGDNKHVYLMEKDPRKLSSELALASAGATARITYSTVKDHPDQRRITDYNDLGMILDGEK